VAVNVDQVPAVRALLADAERDDNVRGVVLTGSAARRMRTKYSDVDVYLVVQDATGAATTRTPVLDTIVVTLDELRSRPKPRDVEGWWSRYSFVDAQVLLDFTDGELPQLVAAWARLDDEEVSACLDAYLDGYINFAYRSLKADRDGAVLERRVDAVESISWLLWTYFGLAGRVRPYNKYLQHELATRPMTGVLAEVDLITELEHLMDDGNPAAQRRLFQAIEQASRQRGKAAIIDAWGHELTLLRTPERR
jgi:predicted nucleotidyltransferase